MGPICRKDIAGLPNRPSVESVTRFSLGLSPITLALGGSTQRLGKAGLLQRVSAATQEQR